MTAYSIKRVQNVPASLPEVWNFFASHANLQMITPPEMNFKVISLHHGENIYAGQIIEYKLTPLPGIPVYWMTEITHVKAMEFFVDEQRKGPYKLWHHQHLFKEIPGGVEMTDIVHYRNPLWVLGNIANALFVKRKLNKLFDYRFNKVEEIFGKWLRGSI